MVRKGLSEQANFKWHLNDQDQPAKMGTSIPGGVNSEWLELCPHKHGEWRVRLRPGFRTSSDLNLRITVAGLLGQQFVPLGPEQGFKCMLFLPLLSLQTVIISDTRFCSSLSSSKSLP